LAADLNWEIVGAEALSARSAEWNRLITSARYPPFLCTHFLLPALAAFGDKSEVVALGRDGERLAVAAVVKPAGTGRWTVFQPSQLPLGACVLARDCTWERALPSLARALPGMVFSMSVTQQDPRLAARPADSTRLETLDYVPTGWIDIDRSFEQFWQARGKNLRQNLRKQRRKLEEQGAKLTFEFLQEEADIESALRDFARLESRGWKADTGTAISMDNAQGRFYQQMLLGFARNERTAFAYRLSRGSNPIAVDFGIRDAESAVILKTTYDESLKGASPAQLLHEQAFERHFATRDVGRIEFYGRMMEWHARWTETSQMLYHLNYFPSPALRRLRAMVRKLRRPGAQPNTEQEAR
jgi:CelD/BcsL family acetyltransferase involved in cellulose biosynthesis